MSFSKFVTILLLCASSFAQSTSSYPSVVTTSGAQTPNFLAVNASFTHTMLALPNSILIVGCSKNTYPATHVTSVSVNGVPMVRADQRTGIPKPTDTSLWYLTGVPAGLATISVTSQSGALHGYGVSCLAQDYYGIDQLNPVELVDTDSVPANQVSVNCAFNPLQDGDEVVMFEYSTAYNQSAPMSASPFAPDIVTGRYYALQMAMAHSGLLNAGQQYSQTWTEHNSTVSVEWTLIALVLRPAL